MSDAAPDISPQLEALQKVIDVLTTLKREDVDTVMDYLRGWNKRRPASEC